MDLTFSSYLQISIALFIGICFFMALYLLPQKITLTALILLIPFQLIQLEYGTLNMLLTYMVGVALILNQKITEYPLLKYIFIIILSYLVAL